MTRRRIKFAAAGLLCAALAGGGAWAWQENRQTHSLEAHGAETQGDHDAHTHPHTQPRLDLPSPREDRKKLGLMTSLPLYWPLGEAFTVTATGKGEVPWQRQQLELDHELVLLDTLSPIPGLGPDDPETDPLEGLERLAIVQPRGLTASDNVALDRWVRGGGRLLLVLDPMLTGHYEAALGDPRRPTDVALMPPVLVRWGLAMTYDPEGQDPRRPVRVPVEDFSIIASMSGEIAIAESGTGKCALLARNVVARCAVGAGEVVFLADAATFEMLVEPTVKPAAENLQLVQLVTYAFGE